MSALQGGNLWVKCRTSSMLAVIPGSAASLHRLSLDKSLCRWLSIPAGVQALLLTSWACCRVASWTPLQSDALNGGDNKKWPQRQTLKGICSSLPASARNQVPNDNVMVTYSSLTYTPSVPLVGTAFCFYFLSPQACKDAILYVYIMC